MDLKAHARALRPVMNIGKNGLSPGALAQLEKELDGKGLVKVKLLKSAHADAVVDAMLAATGAELVQRVGGVVVLYRK